MKARTLIRCVSAMQFANRLSRARYRLLATVLLSAALLACNPSGFSQSAPAKPKQSHELVRPGQPGVRPFWNTFSGRFIFPPAFDFKPIENASKYQFRALAQAREYKFTAAHPWDNLSPIWEQLPEGFTELTVEALNEKGDLLGVAGQRQFYRSPGFPGDPPTPPLSYSEAGRLRLRALFTAQHVQHWHKTGGPDRDYTFYCYPAKIMGAVIRAMAAYAELDPKSAESKEALLIARRAADHLIKISMPQGTPFEYFPPTYSLNVNQPKRAAKEAHEKKWMMTHYGCDAAFGYLDLYRLTRQTNLLAAARRIADTYVRTQQPDGSWPLVVNYQTGKAEAPNRMVPTWVICLFDRLQREHGIQSYKQSRQRAWKYIEQNPLRTFAWDAQFEDTKPRAPYRNLSREQACDVAAILFENPAKDPAQIEMAKELLRFGEDQFIVWSPVADTEGWRKTKLERERKPPSWITPVVLEQYTCYMPVARSSGVFIKAYVAGFKATGDILLLQKARALGNALIAGQQYQMEHHGGKGEIPTWVVKQPPYNWLNNSFYAAQALIELGSACPPAQRP